MENLISYPQRLIQWCVYHCQAMFKDIEQTNLFMDLFDEYSMPNSGKLLAIKRAVVLYLWMKGYEVEAIKKETSFSRLFFADIVRIADVASFITESICILSSQGWNEETAKREDLLKKITKLLQYGVPQSVIFLASLHNYKLTRKKLVSLSNSLDEYNQLHSSERPLRILEYFLQQENQIVKNKKILTETVYKDVVSDICCRYNGGRTTDGIDEVHMCIALDWDKRNHTHISADIDTYYRRNDNGDICECICSLLQQIPFNSTCVLQQSSFHWDTNYGSLNIAVDVRDRINNNGNIIPVPDCRDVFICSAETYGRLVNEAILEYTLITKEGYMTLLLSCLNAKDPVYTLFQVLSKHKPLPSKEIPTLLVSLETIDPKPQDDYHIFSTNDQYATELVKAFAEDLEKNACLTKVILRLPKILYNALQGLYVLMILMHGNLYLFYLVTLNPTCP